MLNWTEALTLCQALHANQDPKPESALHADQDNGLVWLAAFAGLLINSLPNSGGIHAFADLLSRTLYCSGTVLIWVFQRKFRALA